MDGLGAGEHRNQGIQVDGLGAGEQRNLEQPT